MTVESDNVHVNPQEAELADPRARLEGMAVGWLRRQPVLAAMLATAVPLLAGLVTEESWLAGIGLAVLAAVGTLARQAVTPTAQPRLADGVPLVPDI